MLSWQHQSLGISIITQRAYHTKQKNPRTLSMLKEKIQILFWFCLNDYRINYWYGLFLSNPQMADDGDGCLYCVLHYRKQGIGSHFVPNTVCLSHSESFVTLAHSHSHSHLDKSDHWVLLSFNHTLAVCVLQTHSPAQRVFALECVHVSVCVTSLNPASILVACLTRQQRHRRSDTHHWHKMAGTFTHEHLYNGE